jgi:hypothetical protein
MDTIASTASIASIIRFTCHHVTNYYESSRFAKASNIVRNTNRRLLLWWDVWAQVPAATSGPVVDAAQKCRHVR